ncbi:HAMP domain-containing sensor histidine kinase [Bacillus sp. REN10]|uniref:sensor histidine kinase n=1 Tax=Bacillus sp. REN10 TaxID=2782541 RepID=UPI001EED047D|nr:HAMP domain-containing sensor histidine kinase [Bacillus sp. REN10]
MIRSLYGKVTFTTILIMLLSGIAAFLLSNIYYQMILKPYNDQKNTMIAQEMVDYVKLHPEMKLDSYFEHLAAVGYQVYITDGQQEQFYGKAFREANLATEDIQMVLNGATFHGMQQFPHTFFVTGFFANELKNTIGVPFMYEGKTYALFMRPDIKLLFNEMHLLFGSMLFITILLSILFVLISVKLLTNPIKKLTSATFELAQGNFNIQLDINRKDEIGDLAQSFTQMANQLEQLEELRKQLISNISHDIQSPLSNIKGYTALLAQPDLSDEDKLHYADIINKEVLRLSMLTKQILFLASLEQEEQPLKKQSFSLSEQLKQVLRQYQWKMEEKGIMADYQLPPTDFYGDPAQLYAVWDNIMSNAVKYNLEGGYVKVSLTDKPDYVEIRIKNSGVGIDKADLSRIFERFYRADTARSRTIEGTGLGLSIAMTIVHLHHGRIYAKSEKGADTEITVELPKQKTATHP